MIKSVFVARHRMMTAILFFSQNDEYATIIDYGKNFIPGHDVPLKKKKTRPSRNLVAHITEEKENLTKLNVSATVVDRSRTTA